MMGARRIPYYVVLFGGAIFFLLYLLSWNNLPSIITIPIPSPSSLQYKYGLDVWESGPKRDSVLGNNYSSPSYDNGDNLFGESVILSSKSKVPGIVSYREMIFNGVKFNASHSDVLVMLHMQKTGGTSFEKHIVQDLHMEQPCICWKRRKRCKCPRPGSVKDDQVDSKQYTEPWLFSRFSTGWACGLHADWTELTSCVDVELNKAIKGELIRRYFYITMVRNPVHRFLSEFRHVQRGATWKASLHYCDGRLATAQELGSCYSARNWSGVTLRDFLTCPHNMAFNRQTRMLADLSLVGCYNRSFMSETERNRVLLSSAKNNLESMAFVGITEYQRMSQYIFEETFGLHFKAPFTQNEDTYSKATMNNATPEEMELVKQVNSLDIELYAFAEQLLHSRFRELKELDPKFEDHYNYLGEEKGRHFSWDDVEDEQ